MKMLCADLVFRNGQVITVNPQDEICSAIAVKGTEILYVGTDAEASEFIGENTKVIDLEGRSLVPGFIDSHVHYFQTGAQQLEVDCTHLTTIAQIKEKVRQAAAVTPKGEWIRGCQYNEDIIEDGRFINRWDIDEVAPDHPVAIVRYGYHTSILNSKALALAGVDDYAPDEVGGEFHRERGMVNGVCHEACHFNHSKVFDYQPSEYEKVFQIADKFFASMGVTSVHDAGGNGKFQLQTLIDMDARKMLNTRVYMFTYSLSENRKLYEDLLPTGIHTGFGSDRLRIGANKVMLDGSSNTPSASVREPYCHINDKGLLSMDQDELNAIYVESNRAGFQNTAHAVGDNAVDMVLIAHEKALNDYPREDARHRIEHCAIIDDDMIERIKRLGVTPSLQPIFMYEQGERYLKFYGEDRVSRMMAARTMLDAGIIASMGTDCPVYYSHPMINMYAACTRISKKGREISPEQKVTVLEALRMYTLNSAYASYQEDSLGSLEVGKLADLAVLSKPILSIEPEELKDIVVDFTISGGKIIYEG